VRVGVGRRARVSVLETRRLSLGYLCGRAGVGDSVRDFAGIGGVLRSGRPRAGSFMQATGVGPRGLPRTDLHEART
jgi:hypothetical protein